MPKYFCGANTRVYLKHEWSSGVQDNLQRETSHLEILGNAAAISFSIQQHKEPLYSYNDPEFSRVADGKVLVIGKLIMNVSTASPPNYIGKLINEMQKNYIESSEDKRTAENLTLIDNKINAGTPLSTEEIDYLITYSLSRKKTVKGGSSLPPSSRYNADLLFRKGRADQHTRGFDLIITLYETEKSTSILLKDVSIRSIEQEFGPTALPIVESYDFIARTVIYDYEDEALALTLPTIDNGELSALKAKHGIK